jgi:hypothetical protein
MLGELELDTADDFLIAQMLQKQYDKEHDSALHYVSDVIRFFLQKRHHTGNNIDHFLHYLGGESRQREFKSSSKLL